MQSVPSKGMHVKRVTLQSWISYLNIHVGVGHGSASRFWLFSFEKDPRKIVMAKDHARERKKLSYAKTKVSAFANELIILR